MNINGLGLVFAAGRGLDTLTEALVKGSVSPDRVTVPHVPDPVPVLRIPAETLKDSLLPRHMRRADRFSRMVTLAALDAVQQSAKPLDRPDRTGILLATRLGPHVTTFDFLDEILEYGDPGTSPTRFSHSVHNAAASYIAKVLDITGPVYTVTQFVDPFRQALLQAQVWLTSGRCEQVLVGVGDECGAVMNYIFTRKLPIASDGLVRPFAANPAYVPGEGAVFFLFSNSPTVPDRDDWGRVCLLDSEHENESETLRLLDGEWMPPEADKDALALCYTPVFGHMPAGAAFHAAVASLMIKNQRIYNTELFGSPAMTQDVCPEPPLQSISCDGYVNGERRRILVRKQHERNN